MRDRKNDADAKPVLKMNTKRKRHWWYTVLILAILNFAAYFAIALWIGGTAWQSENGKFLLYDHGRYTEVSRAVFIYSRIHFFSIWLTIPVGLIALFVLMDLEKLKMKSISKRSA